MFLAARKQKNGDGDQKRKLNELLGTKYWNSPGLLICFLVKKRVTELMLTPQKPVLQPIMTVKQAIYEFDLPNGVEEHTAFACPSIPSMFAYFDTSTDDQRHIIGLLVNEQPM